MKDTKQTATEMIDVEQRERRDKQLLTEAINKRMDKMSAEKLRLLYIVACELKD